MTADPPKPIEVDPRNWTGDIDADFAAEQERREAKVRADLEHAKRHPLRHGLLYLGSGLVFIAWVASPLMLSPDSSFERLFFELFVTLWGAVLIVVGGSSLQDAWSRRRNRQ